MAMLEIKTVLGDDECYYTWWYIKPAGWEVSKLYYVVAGMTTINNEV